MLEALRKKLAALLDERAAAQRSIDDILTAAEAEARTELNEAETAVFNEARTALAALDETRTGIEAQIADLEQIAEARAKAEAITIPAPAGRETATTQVRVGSEPLTYRQDGDHDFVRDVFLAYEAHDQRAADRLNRHRVEAEMELRAPTGVAADYGTLVVPGYLTEMFAPVLRSGRPFITNVRNLPLPSEGMNVYIPLGTTASTVAEQATENTAVSLTSYGASDLTVPVRTYAGQQVVSRQALDRGRGISEIILADLFADYATKTNVAALHGSGGSGTHYGVLATTGITGTALTTGAASTVLSKIAGGIATINGARYLPPNLIVMHPRRWASLTAATDSSGRPLLGIESGGQNVLGGGDVAAVSSIVGTIYGVPVLSDAGISTTLGASTNADCVIITRTDDCLWWEEPGAPMSVRLDEVLRHQLSVRFVLQGYSAFTAGRYTQSTYVLTGTGLVAPTF